MQNTQNKNARGFAGMPKEKQREVASKGGKASHTQNPGKQVTKDMDQA